MTDTGGKCLEDAANALELHGESRAADFLRRIELERADAARKALEEAASKLEVWSAGVVYSKAMRTAAKLVRALKPA